MFRNSYFKLGLISTIAALGLLIVLPYIPVKLENRWINLNSHIGGYKFSLFNGKYNYDLSSFKRGLDLSGGVKVVLRANMADVPEAERSKAIESAVQVISRRVDMLGVAEPYIAPIRVGDEYRIIVEIPGMDNITDAINLIGQTAQLKFKVLKEDAPWLEDKYQDYFFDPSVWEETGLTGADLVGAEVVFGSTADIQNANKPQIQIRFSSEGLTKFSEIAKQNANKPITIYLDKESLPLSMAVIDPELAGGVTSDPVISGTFDLKQAQALSVQIRAGALPISVEIVEQKLVGALLGEESISKSMIAGIVGFLLVLIFMMYLYKRLGVLAGFALIIYSIIVLAIFKLVPVVLTLPGIAGFILSIGMASDANILIFERIKEEIMWGKPHNIAIKHGFERAWTSIRDSNISSLITAYILFQFGTGPVKGFALTLAIGIVISLFTSIFVVKTLIEVFNIGNYRKVTK